MPQMTFPAGTTNTPTIAVPDGIHGVRVTMSADGWPDGAYTFTLMFSIDNGQTFPGNLQRSATFTSPFNFPPNKAHVCSLSFSQFDVVLTNAKAQIVAPAQFTTTISLDPIT